MNEVAIKIAMTMALAMGAPEESPIQSSPIEVKCCEVCNSCPCKCEAKKQPCGCCELCECQVCKCNSGEICSTCCECNKPKAKKAKICPCSTECACGCNAGELCRCNEARAPKAHTTNPVPVIPIVQHGIEYPRYYQPSYQQSYNYTPQYAAPRFSAPRGRASGC